MPTQRGNGRYYVQKRFPGVGTGRLYKSLQTDRAGLARRREDALVSLYQQGRIEILRAFDQGAVSIAEIDAAFQAGRIGELAARLRRGDTTLGEAIRGALRTKAPEVRDSTLARYETGLGHFRAFLGDGVLVRDALTTDAIQRFKGHRREVDEIAKETWNNDAIAISVLATYAEGKGWIEERPKIKKFKSAVRITYMDAGRITAYMAALRGPFRPLFQFLIGTGCRLGEAEALRVADLRFGDAEARAQIRKAKTSEGVRVVFVPPWVREALEAHLAATGRTGTDRVFQIPRRTVQKEHSRACTLVGIPDYTIHDHRHTAAVHLALAGTPIPLIQKQLGHKHIEETMRYATFSPRYADISAAFDRVADALGVGPAVANDKSDNRGIATGVQGAEHGVA